MSELLGLELGRRELQVLRMMSNGKQALQIARELGIKTVTVNMFRHRIALKSGCKNSMQIGVWAAKRGLV